MCLRMFNEGADDFGDESDWAHRAVDLKSVHAGNPGRETVAAAVIDALHESIVAYAEQGFEGVSVAWQEHDWLRGRDITVDMPDRQITGVAAGVDLDGALLVDTASERERVVNGSIVMAGISRQA